MMTYSNRRFKSSIEYTSRVYIVDERQIKRDAETERLEEEKKGRDEEIKGQRILRETLFNYGLFESNGQKDD